MDATEDGLRRETQLRAFKQGKERDHALVDVKLREAWADFPEGIRLVMRASETADNAWAYRGGKPFLLTLYDLEDLMIRSNGRCELSRVPFSGDVVGKSHKRPFIPSIDRIRPKEPYTFDNCRLVCWAVNLALGEWGDEIWWRIVRSAAAT